MLRRDAADDAGLAQLGAPLGFEHFDFVGQLAQALLDQLGLATGTGGTEQQAALVEIQRRGRQRVAQQFRQHAVAGLIGQPEIRLVSQALAGGGLQIGRQQHRDSGTPGAQQGDGQVAGIFQMQRQPGDVAAAQPAGQAQCLLPQRFVFERRAQCHRPRGRCLLE